MAASVKKTLETKNPPARTPARRKKTLPQTPVRPKVITEYMTPHEAAQRILELAEKSRNGG